METSNKPDSLHPSGCQFWGQICWYRARGSSDSMHKRDLWTYRGLYRGFILRDQTQLGLRCKNNAWHFDAGVHQKIILKIQILRPPQATTLSLFPLPYTVWGKSTDSHSSQHFPKIITQWHQGDTTNYRQHIILCTGGWDHHPHGLKLHRNQTNKGHNKYNGKGQTTHWLSCHKSRCHHPVPRVGHDHEHIFQRVIFIWS